MIDGPQIILVHAGMQPTLDKIAKQVGGVGGFLGAVISTHFPEGETLDHLQPPAAFLS